MNDVLKPVEIEIEGFRSFADKSIIPFPQEYKSSVLINGKYKDGTTSSGSGKSSILMAMAFVLDICDVPATELKSWYNKKINVRFRLTDGANTYDIIKDPKLKIIENGKEFGGTSAGAKEKLKEILKAAPELVKSLTYRPQRERGVFLTNTDSKNKEFLTKVLDLSEVESAVDSFNSEVKSLQVKINTLNELINQSKSQLPSTQVSDDDLTTASEECAQAIRRLEELQDAAGSSDKINQELSNISLELQKITKANIEVNTAKQQNQGIRQKVELLQVEIAKLQSGICHTCEREWNQYQTMIESKNSEVVNLIESMKSNLVVIKNAEPLINPEYHNQLMARRGELQQELGKLAAPMNDAINAKHLAQQRLDNLNRLRSAHQQLIEKITLDEQDLKNMQIELHLTTHAAKILGRQGFLGSIFDEVLAEIKMRANDLMSYIPNINTFSLDISSDSITSSGKVNKSIKVAMYKDGVQKSLKALSGGQMASAELCTDLAVSETVRARSGSKLGWVALDEAMDGLDVETKLAALDAIRSKVDGLLIVVDHSTEIKENFDKVIEVEYDGRCSYVI